MRYKNYILSVSFAFIVLIAFVSLAPEKAVAQSYLPVPTADKAQLDKESGLTIFGVTIKGLTWDLIGITLANVALEAIIEETIAWIDSGFEGNPAYATDPEQLFTDIADNVAGEFIAGSDLGFLCSPFQAKIRLALQRYHAQRRTFQCSLSQVVGNIDAFYTDFSQGGWDGWFSMTQNDVNNPYGAYLAAQVELDSRVAKAIGLQDKQLSWNSGFLNFADCTSWDEVFTNDNPDTPEDESEIPQKGKCRDYGPVKTPGTVINSQLNTVLATGVHKLELADEFDELISALFTQLLKQLVFGAQGLFNDSADSPPESPVALGISKLGTGSGTVTSNPSGIDCGATCFATYARGTSVTLTAVPAPGSIFTDWPGACFGTETCVVNMNTDREVLAMFDSSITLNILKTGNGSGTITSIPAGINCGTVCSADYSEGTSVIITATPAPGSTFVDWLGGGCRGGPRTCVVRMSADSTVTNVTAEFTRGGVVLGTENVAAPVVSNTVTRTLPETGTYEYQSWNPGNSNFIRIGQTFIDPVFGSTVRRLTNDFPSQSQSDIYAKNGFWNADGTRMFHNTVNSNTIINTTTGAVVRSGVPGNFDGSFAPDDPDTWYYFSGASLRKYSIATGATSLVKTFSGTLGRLGGSIDWIDNSGRYMVLVIGGNVRVWDKQADVLYAGALSGNVAGGWAGITPDGKYVVAAGDDKRSYAINHTTRTVNTKGVMFWSLCGDHGDLVSASDGRNYLITFECHSEAAVYRVDITLAQSTTTLENLEKQRRENVLLFDTDWKDDGHFSCASGGINQDWCFVSLESTDNNFGNIGAWRPYKDEIVMVQMVSPFTVRRLAHHRSQSMEENYYHQPRVNTNWSGNRVAWASNFGYNKTGYSDIYGIEIN